MKKKLLLLLFIFTLNLVSAEEPGCGHIFRYRHYDSDRYSVWVEPRPNENCGARGTLNLIRIIIHDHVSGYKYAMHYIVDADADYTYQEYKTNPDLRAHVTPNIGITNHDINQFANRIILEIIGMNDSDITSDNYIENGIWKRAYSRTELDVKTLRQSSGK